MSSYYYLINYKGIEIKLGDWIKKIPDDLSIKYESRLRSILKFYENEFQNNLNILDSVNTFCRFQLILKNGFENYYLNSRSSLSSELNEIIDHKIRELLDRGVLRRSYSKWSSKVGLIRNNRNGDIELYVDYEQLNNMIQDIDEVLEKSKTTSLIKSSLVFTKLVLKDAHYQIPLNLETSNLTAFNTDIGKFEYCVMPKNLKISKFALQHTLESIILNQPLNSIEQNTNLTLFDSVKINLDEILIHTPFDINNHLGILEIVLNQLKRYNFKIDSSESIFLVNTLNCFGREINQFYYSIEKSKLDTILNYPPISTKLDLLVFIDLVMEYVDHLEISINEFCKLIISFNNLIESNDTFYWNSNYENIIDKIKYLYSNSRSLAYIGL